MKSKKRIATVTLAATCALAGAAAGISESSAAKGTSSTKATRSSTAAGVGGAPPGPHGPGGPGGPGGMGREVHAVEVVLNKAGNAYISETDDNGTVTAVDSSAGTITLKEGSSSVTYATPTLTIPSSATVMLDGAASSLDKLAVGDRVMVSSSSEATTVFATDSAFKPAGGPGHGAGPPQPPAEGASGALGG